MNFLLRTRSFCWLLLLASPLLNTAACSDASTARAAKTAFEKNQQLWKSRNVVNYRYTLSEECYCPLQYLGPNQIEVRDGKTESITYIGEGKNIDMKNVKLPDTMEKVFELAKGLSGKSVAYDPTYGFPKMIHIVGPKGSHDTSIIYSVKDFEPTK
jgi:hypothetical protein